MKKLFLLLVLLISLYSCKTPQVTTQVITKDSTIVKEIPRIIEVPGSMVESPSINIDSLVSMIKAGISLESINQTLIKEDPETKLKVGLLIDQLGNLTAVCEQQERQIEIMEKEVQRWKSRYEQVTVEKKPSFWENLKKGINSFAIIILIIIAIVFFVFRR
ncbi:hypothetical protein DN752_21125 [Echinicola strongylocentroti]|uniref:Lipoprotein n=1 Tax=Echinicola strongylocentroti TaxID=1795355 RepID=A0A2Z4IPG4_9BACT|nr:hypothetical protein [Echinicola strongylocentroti]AWW32446.1 hypothetical protein DN752_21125 [Echinicola strongylocentroti]